MSQSDAEKFIARLHTDPVLRQKAHDAAEKIVEMANANGYPDVTREEISAALKAHWKNNTDPTDPDPTQCAVRFSEAPGF
jgi:predicted ribosomally synthesized peptide with nif11-like leader